MRPMSVCCRLPRNSSSRNGGGFTLLELLVVLSIVAMTAGLILPSTSRWIAAARERAWQQELRAQLAALPMRAFQSGEPLELDASALRSLLEDDLPASVQLELSAPLRYSAAGVAAAATVRAKDDEGRGRVWTIAPMTGRVTP
ncbi:type II secretion system protein [Paucibacter sediminis]|uniref:Type II secretion system protein n=1 Tax=Paucibacter sediminis TaxID=3019553 RepID=A0AA95SJH5_9BURK|nr:type II secretion system protein [Paucibacter sp. S2-9]WIT09968.1 type II secretion system protein [Paucibacter sp. S2-9]